MSLLELSDIVVAELYDLTHKLIWYRTYSYLNLSMNIPQGIPYIFKQAREDSFNFLKSLDNSQKPLVKKYRLELKFLVEDKSK
jgi:hypothetical protein